MRRVLGLIAAAAVAGGAFVLPSPQPRVDPVFAPIVEAEAEATASSSIWYCALVESGAVTEGFVGLATVAPVEFTVSLTSPFPGEPADTFENALEGLGAAAIDIGSIIRRGEAPGFVEFSSGPAGSAAVIIGEGLVTGDRCVASSPKLWHLTGGTTRSGIEAKLRLYNPFPENARVELTAVSEFGNEPLPTGSLDVPPRSWRDVNLSEDVPFLDQLAVFVRTDDGIVLPSFVLSNGTDQASWPGTTTSDRWEFPIVARQGMKSDLIVTNPAEEPVVVDIELFTRNGLIGTIDAITVAGLTPARISLIDFATEPLAIAVRASAPVSAAVVAEAGVEPESEAEAGGEGEADTETEAAEPIDEEERIDTRLAGTVGNTAASTRWLLPGAGGIAGRRSSIAILNSGEEPVTVTVRPLAVTELPTEKVVVPAGSLIVDLITRTDADGYVVEASTPISVAWSVADEGAVAFIAGIAVGG